MRCATCSDELPLPANFCPSCGAPNGSAVIGETQRLGAPPATSLDPTLPEGTCPKCGSTEIYANDRGLVNASGGITVLNLHDIWFGSKAAINTYVCASCGYLEMFLADMDKLPDIVRTWRRVGA